MFILRKSCQIDLLQIKIENFDSTHSMTVCLSLERHLSWNGGDRAAWMDCSSVLSSVLPGRNSIKYRIDRV